MTKKIKILHLAEDLKIGGYENVIYQLATGIDKNMFDIHIWCLARGGKTAELLNDIGVNIKVLAFPSYHNPVNILKLRNLIRQLNPDIIHSHTYFSNTFARLASIFPKRAKIIAHIHNVYPDYSIRNVLMERFLSRFTDKIICCSHAVKTFVTQKEKIDPSKTVVIYNGAVSPRQANPDVLKKLKQSLGLDAQTKILLCVAKLTEQKGHQFLLESLPSVIKNDPNIKLLVAGDGPLRASLKKKSQQLFLQSFVSFLGIRQDIADLLQITDVFVLPSLYEGLPIALLEAMSYGLPIIATDAGGVGEVLTNHQNGFLISPANPSQLSDAMIRLFNDKPLCDQIKENNLCKSKQFSSSAMVGKIVDLYRELCPCNG